MKLQNLDYYNNRTQKEERKKTKELKNGYGLFWLEVDKTKEGLIVKSEKARKMNHGS